MRPLQSTRRSDASEPPGSRAGFTLVELLTVMLLLAVILGISVGAISRVGEAGALDVSERLVRSAILRARTAARNQSALARLTIHPPDFEGGAPARIALALTRDAGTWHFDETTGSKVLAGRNNKSSLQGAKLGAEGVVRGAVHLDGGGRVLCEAPVGYDPEGGFSISGWVNPDPECSQGTIFSYGDSFRLVWREDGGLDASLAVGDQGETVDLKTPPARMERGVWAPVELLYDGLAVVIRIHGVAEAVAAERRPVVRPEARARLTFGGDGFSGRLDEVTYRTLEPEEWEDLPTSVDVPLGREAPAEGAAPGTVPPGQVGEEVPGQQPPARPKPLVIRFDAEGRLDPRVHTQRVEIPLELEGETRRLLIDRSGVLR